MFNIKDFKVGDKVKILSEYTGQRVGEVGFISYIYCDTLHVRFDDGREIVMGSILNEDVIVKVYDNTPQHPKDKLIVYIQGTSVVAKYIREDKTSVEATAKCNPEDTFDFLIGAQIALKRLVNKLGKKEVISEAALGSILLETVCHVDKSKVEVIRK